MSLTMIGKTLGHSQIQKTPRYALDRRSRRQAIPELLLASSGNA